MSKMLINEPPLMVLPSLAVKIGLNEAIFIQQLHYWLLTSTNYADDQKWVYNSVNQWQEQFPFWSTDTIKRTIQRLEKSGILISGCFNKMKMDKTKWYRINYEKLKELDSIINRTTTQTLSQNAPAIGASCPNKSSKLPQPIPETTTETTTDNKDIAHGAKNAPRDLSLEDVKKHEKQKLDFDLLRSEYPDRVDKKRRDLDAHGGYQRYCTLIKSGKISSYQLLAAVKAYRKYCFEEGIIGTELVQQISTFFGPKKATYLEYLPKQEEDLPKLLVKVYYELMCDSGDLDKRLTKEHAKKGLNGYLDLYGEEVVIRAIKLMSGSAQYSDPKQKFIDTVKEVYNARCHK